MGVARSVGRRIRSAIIGENLTLRKVVVRSRITFIVFVLAIAGLVQWSNSYQHGQHVRDLRTNDHLAKTFRALRADQHDLHVLAGRIERQGRQIAHNLAIVAFEACTKRNEQRDRLVFIVSGAPRITTVQIAMFRDALGYEKCPPRPPPLASSSSPAAGAGPAPPAAPLPTPAPTTTRPSTTTASRPAPTTTTEPARRHRPRRHHQRAAGIRLQARGGK